MYFAESAWLPPSKQVEDYFSWKTVFRFGFINLQLAMVQIFKFFWRFQDFHENWGPYSEWPAQGQNSMRNHQFHLFHYSCSFIIFRWSVEGVGHGQRSTRSYAQQGTIRMVVVYTTQHAHYRAHPSPFPPLDDIIFEWPPIAIEPSCSITWRKNNIFFWFRLQDENYPLGHSS